MRTLTYTLNNGTEVKTYAEALASGKTYSAKLTDIPEPTHTAPKQAEMLVKGLCPIVGIQ